jgi:protein-S-isoprenylcysteine O-methyltransferase Ste14
VTHLTNTIILGCWIVFFVYWIISAFGVKRIAERQSLAANLAHRIPVALGYWLLAFFQMPPWLKVQVIPRTDFTMAIGAAICVAGLFVTIWARITLAGNWSSDVTFKQDHELIRAGPYRYVRHPIYTGLLLMALGTAIVATQLHCWLGVLAFGAGFWIKLCQEERLLLRHFPDQYPQYQKEVKALIPGIGQVLI